jgi:hypothetical protein
MAVTHFAGPIEYSGKGATGAWGTDLTIAANNDVVVYMDDFLGVAVDATNDWTVVKDDDAAVAIAADTVNGLVSLTSKATTDNDGASIQGNEVFKAASGKSIWFETKLQNNKVAQSDICVGLTVNFATNPEAMLTAADRIVFQVDDGNASILFKTESGGTETSTDSGIDMVDATDVILGFRVSGTGRVDFYVNRNLVATHTTNIPTTELAMAAMSISGDNLGTRATLIDYIFASATR